MKKNSLLNEIRKSRSKSTGKFVKRSFEIVDRIYDILEQQNIDQKQLATALGKHESEVSKWLSGTHNFTIKTISKIESVLDCKIITTYNEFDKNMVTIDINEYHYLYVEKGNVKEYLKKNKSYNAKSKVENYQLGGFA